MALDYSGKKITLLAAEDLSAMQYRYVVQASDTTVQMANAATDIPVGILQNAPGNGEAAVIQTDGISKLVMNGSIAVGDEVILEYVGATDNGKGAPDAAANDLIVGVCVFASGAEDDVGAVKLVQYRRHAT
jgi:hypothetical protein